MAEDLDVGAKVADQAERLQRLRRDVRAQLNVENITNRLYYATSQGNNNIMPGAPRSLKLSLSAGI